MKGLKLYGIQAGYVSWDPSERTPELKHAGEEWAFPEHSVSAHHHAVHELHLQLTGTTEWTIEGEVCTVEAGRMIVVAPKRQHSMRPLQNHAHHFIYCAIDLPAAINRFELPPLPIEDMKLPWFLIHEGGLFESPLKTLSQEVTHSRLYRDEIIHQSVGTLVSLIARHLRERLPEQQSLQESELETSVEAKIKTYIDIHVAEKLCISDLADFVGISRSSLFDVMRKELGTTPGAYHAMRRIDQAKTMLRTSTHLPITNIALDLGYGSSQHFSVAFRKATGISPSQYRGLH